MHITQPISEKIAVNAIYASVYSTIGLLYHRKNHNRLAADDYFYMLLVALYLKNKFYRIQLLDMSLK